MGKGEIEAARAIGMPVWLRFRRIVAPQVMRFALPGLGYVWQLNLKDFGAGLRHPASPN